MPSLSSSSATKSTEQSTTTKPLGWQEDALKGVFSDAKGAYGEAKGVQGPDNFVAQFSPEQIAIFNKMMGLSGDPAAGNLMTQGSASAVSGLQGLGAFNPKGGTDYNIGAASQYADNPYMSGMVDAAMRDANRQVSEQVLPQIGRNAALTGNVNSSRRAISEGLVQRGLAEKTADVSSQLRGNAYQQGLGLAQAEANASNDATLKALLGQVSGGAAATGVGTDATKGLYGLATQGVAGQQDAKQADLSNQLQQYQFGTQSPFDALNNYYNIVGNKSWGSKSNSTGTTTTTSTPSTLDTIGKAIGIGGQVFGPQGFNFLPSDRRIKRDIAEIGITHDGLPIYRYRYVNDGSETTHIGLMAQDVERVFPEAVRTINGVKHVNYDLATREAIVT